MRLIDADALIQKIAENVYPVQDFFNSRDYGMFFTGGIEKAICESPSVDAVQVVRCKDCRWWDKKDGANYGYCHAAKHGYFSKHWEISIYRTYKPDFFCADGERRSE
jgi:hypothetical protein